MNPRIHLKTSPVCSPLLKNQFIAPLLAAIALVGIFLSQAHAASTTYTWAGVPTSGTDWNTPGNWASDTTIVPGGSGGASTDVAAFTSATSASVSGAVNVSTSVSLAALYFTSAGYVINASPGQTISLSGMGGSNIIIQGTAPSGGTGIAETINANIALPSNAVTAEEALNGGAITINGTLSGSPAAITFTSTVSNGANRTADLFVLNAVNTFTAPITIYNDPVQINSDAAFGNVNNTITFGNGYAGIDFNYNAGTETRTVTVANNASMEIVVQGGDTVKFNHLTLSGANTELTKLGNGTLQLNSNNQFDGTGTAPFLNMPALASGILDLNSFNQTFSYWNGVAGTITNSAATTGTLTFNGSATVCNEAGNAGITGSLALIFGATTPGLFTMSSTHNTFTGGFTITSGTVQNVGANAFVYGSGDVTIATNAVLDINGGSPTTGLLSGTGTVRNTGVGATLTLNPSATGDSQTFVGSIGGVTGDAHIGLTISAGHETLNTANTYTGTTTVGTGALLTLGNSAAIGFGGNLYNGVGVASAVVNAGGTLDLGGQNISKPITLSGTLTNSNAGATATVNNGVAGTNTSVVGLSAAPTVSYSGGGGTGAAATATLGVTAANYTIGAGVGYTAAPTVTISGGGGTGFTATVTLSGQTPVLTVTNPGTGYTSVPTVAFTGGGASTEATATYNSSSFLLNILQTTAGTGYTSAPTVTISGSTTVATAVLGSLQLTASSSIGGAGPIVIDMPVTQSASGYGITKYGADTVTLAAANTYTGATVVNSGDIAVNGSLVAGSTVTVGGASATGAPTLSGGGTVSGAVTVNGAGGGAAGTINPGATAAAPTTLTVGSITFNSGGDFGVDINASASDKLVISGAASIASGADISFTQLATPVLGNYVLATAASGLNSHAFTGTIPTNYRLLATATALDLTHEAVQTLSAASPATINIITGGTTGVTATLTNTAPVNSSALAVSLADGGSTGGALGSFTGSGPVAANNGTLSVGAILTAGGTGSGLTWSLSNTDPNATTASTSTGGTVNVYGHAAPSLTAGTLNVGDIHAGYAGTVASTNSLSATNGAGFRVNLAGSAPAVNGDALNSITGITPGSVGSISATVPNALGVGAINDSFTYTFADNSILNGASSNVGTAAITVSGQVYSGQMVWTGASDAWSTDADWVDSQNSGVHAAPGLDTNFTTVDTATFGSTTGPVTVSLNGAAPSLNSVTFTGAGNYTIAQGSGSTGLTFAGTAPSITATGTQIISAPVTLASNLTATVTNSGDSLTISGAIGDNSSGYGLTTGGAGTVTLSANNSYTGATNVTAGALIVSGSLSGSSSTTVTNATLEGTGNIANGVTVGNGSDAPGTAIIEVGLAGTTGALSTGALTLYSDAVYQFNLNPTLGTSDVLNVNGTLTLNSGAALAGNLLSDEILSGGQVFDIANFTAIAGTFAGLADGTTLSLGDNSYVINYGTAPGYADEITLTATAVPEPQTWAMLIAGAGMLLVFKRKR